jgi:competence protein ComEC
MSLPRASGENSPALFARFPGLKAALAVCAGILGGSRCVLPLFLIFLILVVLSGIALAGFISRRSGICQTALLFSLVLSGLIRIQQDRFTVPRHHICCSQILPGDVIVEGWIACDPCKKPSRWTMEMESVRLIQPDTSLSVCGRIQVTVYDTSRLFLRYGDALRIRGRLEQPQGRRNPGGFDYRHFLASKHIRILLKANGIGSVVRTGRVSGRFLFRSLIYPLRRKIRGLLNRSVTGTSHPLILALLLGDKSELDSRVLDRFGKAGMIHVLAVSGLHVGYIIVILQTLAVFLRLRRTGKTLFLVAGLTVYALLTGSRPPVVRASLMTSLYQLGRSLEREGHPVNTLGTAALILLLVRPSDLFQTGFLLSFSAALSLIVLYPAMRTIFSVRGGWSPASSLLISRVRDLLYLTLSVQIGVLPVTAAIFHKLPFLALLVNLAALPWTGLALALGFITVVAGAVHPWLGTVYGGLTREVLILYSKTFQWVGNLAFSHGIVSTPGPAMTLAYYSLLAALLPGVKAKVKKTAWFVFLVSVNLFVWSKVFDDSSRRITWVQLDVGQGDAAILHLPRGKILMIDGGDRTPDWDCGKQVILPYLYHLGIRRIDGLVITHAHNDHLGGLISIADNIPVKRVFTSDTCWTGPLSRQLLSVLRKRHIPVYVLKTGDTIRGFPGVCIRVLSPGPHRENTSFSHADCNNRSLVLRLKYGRIRLLFMGDAEQDVEKRLLRSRVLLKCDGLKAGHHGSATSSSGSFLQNADPSIAVISVGRKNRFNHPSEAVLDRFASMSVPVYRTDRSGAVVLQTRGDSLKAIVWH